MVIEAARHDAAGIGNVLQRSSDPRGRKHLGSGAENLRSPFTFDNSHRRSLLQLVMEATV